MQRAYLALSLSMRPMLNQVVEVLREILEEQGIALFVFVDHFSFTPAEESAMMQQAFQEIDHADLLIAECSEKAIGVGIEAGYALGKGKNVWYLRQINSPHSTTLSGAAQKSFIYSDPADLGNQIKRELQKNS
ncbi:MAG: nucleoside 2-deoxyribosyltransferase [Sediminibacterium sp.]|jgi:2'-deoxynucleoside 5'-phosphate N-hydrolase